MTPKGDDMALETMTTTELTELVERAIDGSTVDAVLAAIASICAKKGSHFRTARQDVISAKYWERADVLIHALRDRIDL